MKEFGKFCVGVIAVIVFAITRGIVVSNMWNWFIAPLGVTTIGLWLAVGISMTISLFTINSNGKKRDFLEALKDTFSTCVAMFMVLGLGAIVKLFI